MPAIPFAQDMQPARGGFAVTPTDGAGVQWTTGPVRSLWVGGAGNVALVGLDGNTVTLSGVAAGTLIPIGALRVNSTNTTATLIVGLL